MKENFHCACCDSFAWEHVAAKTYSAQNLEVLRPYLRTRLQVLFEVWFRGTASVELTTLICKVCGFVCYSPRPETDDIDAKYHYLNVHPEALPEYSARLDTDSRRSAELFQSVSTFLREKLSTKVLDFGGGNGRLLHEFIKNQMPCSIIEYLGDPIPGVRYLGSDPDQVDERFDLIICSHVLEHLADPYRTLLQLRRLLSHNGLLYIEVPQELWNSPPPKIDPVTHINFFCVQSLFALLSRVGLSPLYCTEASFLRPNGMRGIAVKALVKLDLQNAFFDPDPNHYLKNLGNMKPNLLRKVTRLLRHPDLLLNLIRTVER